MPELGPRGTYDWVEDVHGVAGGIERRRKMFEAYLGRLRPFRGAALNAQDRMSYRLLEWQLHNQLDGMDINSYYMAINQTFGTHLNVFLIFSLAPANTIRDYENLVTRLRASVNVLGPKKLTVFPLTLPDEPEVYCFAAAS